MILLLFPLFSRRRQYWSFGRNRNGRTRGLGGSGQLGLENGEEVLDSPIEGETGREIVEEDHEHQRHVTHNLLLGGVHAW